MKIWLSVTTAASSLPLMNGVTRTGLRTFLISTRPITSSAPVASLRVAAPFNPWSV